MAPACADHTKDLRIGMQLERVIGWVFLESDLSNWRIILRRAATTLEVQIKFKRTLLDYSFISAISDYLTLALDGSFRSV